MQKQVAEALWRFYLFSSGEVCAAPTAAIISHAWLDDCAVHAMRKYIYEVLTVVTLVARNSNETMVTPVVGYSVLT
jgi:hypothetical protein